jgi:isopenicillin N synthase-like dioxygenase
MSLNGVIVVGRTQVRAELYLRRSTAKHFFALLFQQKNEIERELGYGLDWQELPEGQDCRIAVSIDADPANEADCPRQHDWLATRLNEMYRVFAPRVRDLEPE